MLGAKADYYEKQCDDLTLSRILKAVGPTSNPIPNPNPDPDPNPHQVQFAFHHETFEF